MLSGGKSDVKRPEDVDPLPTPDTASAALADDIFSHEIFEPFSPRWPGMEEDRKALKDVLNPSIVLPPYVLEERKQAFLNELVEKERPAAQTAPVQADARRLCLPLLLPRERRLFQRASSPACRS